MEGEGCRFRRRGGGLGGWTVRGGNLGGGMRGGGLGGWMVRVPVV